MQDPADPILEAPTSPGRRRFLKVAAATVLTGLGTAAYAKKIEPNEFETTRRSIALKGWPSAHAGFRIVHLSDFHCDSTAALHRTHTAVKMALAEKPDAIFLTGDYITYKPQRWVAPCSEALAPLAEALPGRVFAVPGNHDWWCGGIHALTRHFANIGIPLMRNDAMPLPGAPGVWVVGLDDRCVNRQNHNRALRHVPFEALNLLLVHEPDYVDECPPGFALQFSGHSHGGQVCLPLVAPLYTPRYGRRYPVGLQQGPYHSVYTTRGIGMMGPQVRLFCPPEVTVLTLYPKTA